MEHIAQGKRSDTLGLPHSRVSAPCKGKSFNPLCCYSYLIADLAVLKWSIVCASYSHLRHVLKLLPLQGATAPTRDTQGAASLALGYVLHWAFSPHLLNPKLESVIPSPSSYFLQSYALGGALSTSNRRMAAFCRRKRRNGCTIVQLFRPKYHIVRKYGLTCEWRATVRAPKAPATSQ